MTRRPAIHMWAVGTFMKFTCRGSAEAAHPALGGGVRVLLQSPGQLRLTARQLGALALDLRRLLCQRRAARLLPTHKLSLHGQRNPGVTALQIMSRGRHSPLS